MKEATKRRQRRIKLGAVLALVAITIGVFASGAHEQIQPEKIQAALLAAGIWGGVLYVVAFGVIQPLHISAHVFIVAASLVWPPGTAILLAFLGSMACAALSYGFGAWVGEDWVRERLPDKFLPHLERVQEHSFKATLGVKLVFFTTPVLQMAFGAFKVRFWPCMAATALIHLLYVVPEVLLGGKVVEWVGL